MPGEFFGSPTAAQLTEAVREFLVSLADDLPPERAFHLRVAVNALRIVERVQRAIEPPIVLPGS